LADLHYLTYDPEEIWNDMVRVYVSEGGDVLYGGDEKEILLRTVQAALTQAFAAIDNALRMRTLRFTMGEYMDIYGEDRTPPCPRLQATAATAEVRITFQFTGLTGALPAGTGMTADGERFYRLIAPVPIAGIAQDVNARVECTELGAKGNGMPAGAQMRLAVTHPAVVRIVTLEESAGGQEREADAAYKERIRLHGLISVTTGPASQYEAAAKAVTSDIVDAKALFNGAGGVRVILLLKQDEGASAILQSVESALNPRDARPLTDTVVVAQASVKPYALHVLYRRPAGADIGAQEAFADAIREYAQWQDNAIGRPFNPDRLVASFYRAGAERVVLGEGSHFAGGAAAYTEIKNSERCKGEISMAVI